MKFDKLLINGNFYTQNRNRPRATAIAIQNGKIAAVGETEDLRSLGRETIDLNGAFITPGLVDAHVHFRNFALMLQQVDVAEIPAKSIGVDRVAERIQSTLPGKWIIGRGWKNELWEDPTFPGAADLDPISPDHPVLLLDKSHHAGWVNSAALRTAGITAETPDPEGGEIGREVNGTPNGMLFETAIDLVRDRIPPFTDAEIVDAMRFAQQKCWEVGLTGLHDFDGPDCFRALQTLHRQGELGLRIYKNIPASYLDQAISIGLQTDFGDEWLRIGGVKIFADGALGPQTALMLEPYETDSSNYGIAVTDKEEMFAIANRAAENRLSVTIHAIGDKAVHDVLDVYEKIDRTGLRHRVEHVQIFHPDDRDRLAALGVVASMQPIHAISDMAMADRLWGKRAKFSYAWRDMLDSGALLALGSDCPVEPIDVLPGIHAAVTRTRPDLSHAPFGWYPEQRLSIEETIAGFTLGPAATSGQLHRFGSIEVGKMADLTVLDRDLTTIDPDEILNTGIVSTWVNGTAVFDRS